ncbi:MAG: fumarate hydratase, partial [Syntrophales bacterium]
MSMVREIPSKSIEEAVRGLFLKANVQLGQDVKEAIEYFSVKETSPLGRHVLERILENAGVAVRESLPICQDTGLAVIFLEIGQDVHITEGNLEDAVQAGVRRAYQDGC